MPRRLRLWVLGSVLLLVLLFGGNRFASARSVQLFGTIIDRVETSQRIVALTFDDGPRRAALDRLLPLLAAAQVRATFFVQGQVLEGDATLGRDIVSAGHELGNHSYSHNRMVFKSRAFIAQEIERTDRAIRAAGELGPIYFRPPYGKKLIGLPRYLAEHGRPTVTWDVETKSESSPVAIAQQVIADTRPGSIILLHVMYSSCKASLDAMPGILRGLMERGYRFVRVAELISERERSEAHASQAPW